MGSIEALATGTSDAQGHVQLDVAEGALWQDPDADNPWAEALAAVQAAEEQHDDGVASAGAASVAASEASSQGPQDLSSVPLQVRRNCHVVEEGACERLTSPFASPPYSLR